MVRVEEMRQSLRIIEQCVKNMPEGPYKSDHPLATPPVKDRTMHDIETLITHFLSVSWGPVMPVGEALGAIEGTKGNNGYYLVSDGSTVSYRTRIRTPSFAHIQTLPRAVAGSDDSGFGCHSGQPGFCIGGYRPLRNSSDVDRGRNQRD